MKNTRSWTPTRYQGLYRHKSSIYYARIAIDGKETWRSLKTTVLEVARAKLDELRSQTASQSELRREKTIYDRMVMEDAFGIRKRQLENDPSIKKSTRHYWGQLMASLRREWPELSSLEVRNVTIEQCQDWAGRFAKEASPTRYNNSIALLKQLFEIGIEHGARRANPAARLKRMRVISKDLSERRVYVGQKHPPQPHVTHPDNLPNFLYRHLPHQRQRKRLKFLREMLALALPRRLYPVNVAALPTLATG